MINIIELGSSGGGGVAPPANGWLAPPAMTTTTMNGLTDACGLFCNVLDIGDRNYFSCLAAGDYTVSVYTAVNGTLISSQNIAANVQCNWQIDWAACTHNVDADTRQAYVEITPQSGQSLTLLRFNTNHPAETNAYSAPAIAHTFLCAPNLTTAANMFDGSYFSSYFTITNINSITSLSVTFRYAYSVMHISVPATPLAASGSNTFSHCFGVQSIYMGDVSGVAVSTNMFGSTTVTATASLRKLITNGLGTAFPSATTFVLRYTAIQAQEALEWVASLGSSTNTITFDLRNNPFSTSTLVAPAILAKFPNAVVQLV